MCKMVAHSQNTAITDCSAYKCHAEGTMIMTPSGATAIEDVNVGDVIYDEFGNECHVSDVSHHDVDTELIDLTTFCGGHLRLTPSHKVKVSPHVPNPVSYYSGGKRKNKKYLDTEVQTVPQWMSASDIQQGDWVYMPIPERHIDDTPIVYDLADFISENIKNRYDIYDDKIVHHTALNNATKDERFGFRVMSRTIGMSRHAIRNCYYDKPTVRQSTKDKLSNYLAQYGVTLEEWRQTYSTVRDVTLPRYVTVDEDFLYLIGYYIADGNTHGDSEICLAYNDKDIEYQENARAAFRNLFNLEGSSQIAKGKHSLSIIWYENAVMNLFKYLVPDTVESKQIPECFMHLNDKLTKALIHGLIDGDGSVISREAKIKYASISKKLVYQLKWLLLTFGIQTSVHVRTYQGKPDTYHSKYCKYHDITKWHDSYTLTITTCELMQDMYGIVDKKSSQSSHMSYSDESMIYMRVKYANRYHYCGSIYDLTTDNDESCSYVTETCVTSAEHK